VKQQERYLEGPTESRPGGKMENLKGVRRKRFIETLKGKVKKNGEKGGCRGGKTTDGWDPSTRG